MSRRKKQQIRSIQRATGASYRQARNVHGQGPSGPGGPGGPVGSGGPGPVRDDGWPRASKDLVVGEVIATARLLVGNSLPDSSTPSICAALNIPVSAVGGDVMVTSVTAGPEGFPDIESSRTDTYEYGLELYEVTLGMDVDVELVLPVAAAAGVVATDRDAHLLEQDGVWATVAVKQLPLQIAARLRFESESVEILEYWVTLRDE